MQVPNSFEWRGVWMLTAPNMAGKSSLMRATTVAALLGNAGAHVHMLHVTRANTHVYIYVCMYVCMHIYAYAHRPLRAPGRREHL